MMFHNHHIVPRHMGGTDHRSNILKVNVALHAFLHKLLWEEHGCWQDELAWRMLSKQIGKDEAIRISRSEGGKKNAGRVGTLNSFYGKKHSTKSIAKMKATLKGRVPHNKGKFGTNNVQSKLWKVTDPQGNVTIIKGLSDYCKNNGLTYQAMGQVALGNLKQHKKYKCERFNE